MQLLSCTVLAVCNPARPTSSLVCDCQPLVSPRGRRLRSLERKEKEERIFLVLAFGRPARFSPGRDKFRNARIELGEANRLILCQAPSRSKKNRYGYDTKVHSTIQPHSPVWTIMQCKDRPSHPQFFPNLDSESLALMTRPRLSPRPSANHLVWFWAWVGWRFGAMSGCHVCEGTLCWYHRACQIKSCPSTLPESSQYHFQ